MNGNWIRFPVTVTADDIGKTAVVKAKIYANDNCAAHIMSNDTVKSSVSVPKSTEMVQITLNTLILEDSETIKFNFSSTTPIYIDSLECYFSNL